MLKTWKGINQNIPSSSFTLSLAPLRVGCRYILHKSNNIFIASSFETGNWCNLWAVSLYSWFLVIIPVSIYWYYTKVWNRKSIWIFRFTNENSMYLRKWGDVQMVQIEVILEINFWRSLIKRKQSHHYKQKLSYRNPPTKMKSVIV